MRPRLANVLLLGAFIACDHRAVISTETGRSASTSDESSRDPAEHRPRAATALSLNQSWPERPARLGSVTLESYDVVAGEVSNAPKVLAGLITGMRVCYSRGREEDLEQAGKLTVRLRVGPEGEVTQSSFEGSVPLTQSTLDCISDRLGMATFARPEGPSATILFRLAFTPID